MGPVSILGGPAIPGTELKQKTHAAWYIRLDPSQRYIRLDAGPGERAPPWPPSRYSQNTVIVLKPGTAGEPNPGWWRTMARYGNGGMPDALRLLRWVLFDRVRWNERYENGDQREGQIMEVTEEEPETGREENRDKNREEEAETSNWLCRHKHTLKRRGTTILRRSCVLKIKRRESFRRTASVHERNGTRMCVFAESLRSPASGAPFCGRTGREHTPSGTTFLPFLFDTGIITAAAVEVLCRSKPAGRLQAGFSCNAIRFD